MSVALITVDLALRPTTAVPHGGIVTPTPFSKRFDSGVKCIRRSCIIGDEYSCRSSISQIGLEERPEYSRELCL